MNPLLNKQEFRKFAVKGQGLNGLGVDQYLSHMEGIARPYVNNMTRSVIEERPQNFREIDVFSRLIMDRIVFLGTAVDDYIANILTAQMLFLESADAKKDILLYINSPGGSVYAGLGIYDTMQYVNPDVATICTGLAASMGAVLLAGLRAPAGSPPAGAAPAEFRAMMESLCICKEAIRVLMDLTAALGLVASYIGSPCSLPARPFVDSHKGPLCAVLTIPLATGG